MKKITFNPEDLTGAEKEWWDKWSKRAVKSTEEIIAEYESKGKIKSEKFKGKVWSDLKKWLLANKFDEKCAYCESPRIRTEFDAEHFRPKGGVKYKTNEEELTVKCDTPSKNDVQHPGYFWLAYDWKNLLPSCRSCNAGKGKMNQFPAKNHVFMVEMDESEVTKLYSPPIRSKKWNNYYYISTEDLDNMEDRQLLHPFYDDPQKHLKFGIGGLVVGLTPIGDESIKVFDLEEEDLKIERDKAQVELRKDYFINAATYKRNKGKSVEEFEKEVYDNLRNEIIQDEKIAYSSALLDYHKFVLSKLLSQ